MSNSPLIQYVKISPNKTVPRNKRIDRITVHMVVGQLTVEVLGNIFADPARKASSNYGIGLDGKIAMYCEEKDRSWCSSSAANDNRAITIEVASDKEPPYKVTDAAWNSLLNLCTDICWRNGKMKLLWFGDRTKTLKYVPKPDEMVLTVHKWFAPTDCPGQFLYGKQGEIAKIVTERLSTMEYEQFKEYMARYEAEKKQEPADDYALKPLAWAVSSGLIEGDGKGNLMPRANITREDMIVILKRYNERF